MVSGIVLIWSPEIDVATNGHLYDATPTTEPITPEEAVAAVSAADPGFGPADVVWNRGVWEVYDADYARQAHVDPGTGEVLGVDTRYDGVMGFFANLHMCGLTCEEYPGHVPFLAKGVPLVGSWFVHADDEPLTWGGLLLGLSGLVLLVLAVSGIVLWWPGIRRLSRGLAVRARKGRYAVNYDLHKVVGMAAIPFLLMWAVTGMGFEFRQVSQAWYAMLPGSEPAEAEPFTSTPVAGQSVGMSEAMAIAERTVPGSRAISVSVPDRSDATSAYSVWVADGIDPYAYGPWPGDVAVAVDRYSGDARVTAGGGGRPFAQAVWEDWNFTVHAGTPVNGWWRGIWLLFALTPLLLAVTGVTTWVIRRGRRRRKRPGARAARGEPQAG